MPSQKVLLFAYSYPPAQAAGIFRTLRFVRYLPEFGWNPLVLTVRPESLHHKRIDHALDAWTPPGTVVERTTVLRPISKTLRVLKSPFSWERCNNAISTNNSQLPREVTLATRELTHSSLAKRIVKFLEVPFSTPDAQIGWMLPAISAGLKMIRRHRPTVLFSTGPPHSSHLIAIIVKKLTGLPLAIDFRDPWARCDWQLETSILRDRANRWLESFCVKHSDRVILNTNTLKEEFCNAYHKSLHPKFTVIPNGYDPTLRDRAEALLNDRVILSQESRLLFCHPGTVYGNRSIQPLVEAIKTLTESQESISFEQVGLVDEEAQLIEAIRKNRLEDAITLLGQQTHKVTLQRMAAADAFVVIQPGTSIQVPGKLYEMLPFKKPILALSGKGETADLITKYNLGVVASPDDHETIVEAIRELTYKIRAKHSFGWQEALEAFEGRKLTGDLAAILDQFSARQSHAMAN